VPTSVLIVDDDASFRRLAADLLRGRGYAVAGEAPDGAGALHAAARLRPDAALVDVGLPDMDGVAVARRLAAVATRVLLTSSGGCPLDDAGIRDAGAAGFIAKVDLATTDLAPYLG
jgi:CheY-like chemotaxis protein